MRAAGERCGRGEVEVRCAWCERIETGRVGVHVESCLERVEVGCLCRRYWCTLSHALKTKFGKGCQFTFKFIGLVVECVRIIDQVQRIKVLPQIVDEGETLGAVLRI